MSVELKDFIFCTVMIMALFAWAFTEPEPAELTKDQCIPVIFGEYSDTIVAGFDYSSPLPTKKPRG